MPFITKHAGLRRTPREWSEAYTKKANQILDFAGDEHALAPGVEPITDLPAWSNEYLKTAPQDLNFAANDYALSGITPITDLPAWSSEHLFSLGRSDLNLAADVYGQDGMTVQLTDIVSAKRSGGLMDNLAGVWSPAPTDAVRRSDKGALFEATKLNACRNNSWAGVVASDGVELLTNNLFTTGITGWTAAQPGTSTVAWIAAGIVALTGDGTNPATLQQAFAVVAGRTYTLQFTNLLAALGFVRVGTTPGGSDLLNQTNVGVGSFRFYTFTPSASGTVYLTFGQTAATTVRIVLTSVQWQTILPTSPAGAWSITNFQGALIQVVATGIVNGLPYADYRFHAPAGSTTVGGGGFYWDSATGIAAAQNQQWALSAQIARIAGATTNITALNFVAVERPNGVSNTSTSILGLLTSTLQKFLYSFTVGGATAANLQPSLQLVYGVGAAFDITLRIAAVMTTLGVDTGSPILTANGSVTRTADQVTEFLTTGSDAGTIVIYGTAPPVSGTHGLWAWDDGTPANAIRVFRDSSNRLHGTVFSGGIQRCDLTLGTLANGAKFKAAFGWDANGFMGVLNAGVGAMAGAAPLPVGVVTQRFGADTAGNYWESYIEHISLMAIKESIGIAQNLTT